MIIKPALFACVVTAALGGCRDDRTSNEMEFGRTVEPSSDLLDRNNDETIGAGAGARAWGRTTFTNEAGHTEHGVPPVQDGDSLGEERIDAAGTTNQNTGAAVQGRRLGQQTRTPTMRFGSSYRDRVEGVTQPSPEAAGTSSTGSSAETPGELPSEGAPEPLTEPSREPIEPTPEPVIEPAPGPMTPPTQPSPSPSTNTGAQGSPETSGASAGTSETASGHGTPTRTGINTENAGTGGGAGFLPR